REVGKDVKVTEVLGIAAESLESDFKDQPEITADLDNTLRVTYLSLGQFESAERHLVRSLETRLAIFPRTSIEVASSLNNYAKLLVEKGDLDEAERLYEEALRTFRHHLGNYDLRVANVLENLSYLVAWKARYDESIDLYDAELNILRRVLGEKHPEVARILGKLGSILTVLDKRERAEPLHRKALEILNGVHGPEHPTSRHRHSISSVRSMQKNPTRPSSSRENRWRSAGRC
ncbi:MAG: tetratricopeptide repeat protein, partial [Pyrinomonadaceae bacterium]